MLLQLWSTLLAVAIGANSLAAFNMTLSKDNFLYGDTLAISIDMVAAEEMQNATVSLYLPAGLDFYGTVNQQICDPNPPCNNKSSWVEKSADVRVSEAIQTFDTLVVMQSKLIQLVPVSNWQRNTAYSATLQLQNISTNDPQKDGEFVVILLQYWSATSSAREAATRKFIRLRFTLVPVQLSLQVGRSQINRSSINVYLSSRTLAVVRVFIDPRGLPVLIQFNLPSSSVPVLTLRNDTFTAPGWPLKSACLNSSAILATLAAGSSANNCSVRDDSLDPLGNRPSIISIESRTVTLDKGQGQVITLPVDAVTSVNDTVQVLLSPSSVNAASTTCQVKCSLNLTVSMLIDGSVAKIGDSVNLTAEAKFGKELGVSVITDPLILNIVGPDLEIVMTADPTEDLEAGSVVNYEITLKHAVHSTEDLTVSHFEVLVPDIPGLQIEAGSLRFARNGNALLGLNDSTLNLGGFPVGDLGTKDVFVLAFTILLNDAIKIDNSIMIQARATFDYKSNEGIPCLPSPCQNGGTCIESTADAKNTCQCTGDFTGADCSSRVCKTGWQSVPYTTRSCFAFPNKQLPFTEAEAECVQRGGHLVSVHSQQDQKSLAVLWQKSSQSITDIWVGLRRGSAGSGRWQWTDATPYDFYIWYDGNANANVKNNCAISSINNGVAYSWLAQNCSQSRYYFCQDRALVDENDITIQRSITVLTKKLRLQSINLGLKNTLRIFEPVNISFDMAMPLGTLADVQLETTFQSAEIDPIPIKFLSSNLNAPATIAFGTPSLKELGPSKFKIREYQIPLDSSALPNGFARRRKRQSETSFNTTDVLIVIRPIGDIVNRQDGGKSGDVIKFLAAFLTEGIPGGFAGSKFTMTARLTYNGLPAGLGDTVSSAFVQPYLLFEKRLKPSSGGADGKATVVATISHNLNSSGAAYAISFVDNVDSLLIENLPSGTTKDGSLLRMHRDVLNVGEQIVLTYDVTANQEMTFGVESFRDAELNYSSLRAGEFVYAEVWHNHGYSLLAFIIAMLLAFLLLFLVHFLWYYLKNKNAKDDDRSSRPGSSEDGKNGRGRSNGDGVLPGIAVVDIEQSDAITGATEPLHLQPLLNGSEEEDTIIAALIEPSEQDVIRHLDRMDISANEKVESELQTDKLDTMSKAQQTILNSLAKNGEITKPESETFSEKLNRKLSAAMKNAEKELANALEKVQQRIDVKNREEVDNLLAKQAAEKTEALVGVEKETEKQELMGLLDQQHAAEMKNTLYKLQLDQEEELQKLRKDLEAKKEAFLSELQTETASEMRANGKLLEDSADVIATELEQMRKQQTEQCDQERAKQRALLTEKYDLRIQLAKQKELTDAQMKELLSKLLLQQFEAVDTLIKKGLITSDQANDLKKQLQAEAAKLKAWLGAERQRQERKLQEKNAAERKQKITALKQKQKQELNDLEQKLRSVRQDENKNPLKQLQQKQELRSEQRVELRKLENRCDTEAWQQLRELHESLGGDFTNKMTHLTSTLFQQADVPQDALNAILAAHEAELQKLAKQQEAARERQSSLFADELLKRRKDLKAKMEAEIDDQSELRLHERSMFQILLGQQANMSDEEREQLLHVQRQHLAQLENSLTLTRLQQKQLLERKLKERRQRLNAKLRHKLQSDQEETIEKRLDTASTSNDSIGDNERNEATQGGGDLVKQKLKILQEGHFDIDAETRKIQEEMLEERAKALREQEEHIGTIISKLQVDKSRELATIEKQEEALNGLSACMVEDMNERGVISNPECHKIIERHQLEQKQLEDQLATLRQKQQTALKQRLEERALLKRQELQRHQQRLMANVAHASTSSDASKVEQTIDVSAVIHEQAVEKERVQFQLDREVAQGADEQTRSFELQKTKALKDQELAFIGTLISTGNFTKPEVCRVLTLVFPDKSKKEISDIVKQLFAGVPSNKNANELGEAVKKPSRLEEKVLNNSMTEALLKKQLAGATRNSSHHHHHAMPSSEYEDFYASREQRRRKRRNKKRPQDGSSFYERVDGAVTKLPPILSKRPEPVGRASSGSEGRRTEHAMSSPTQQQPHRASKRSKSQSIHVISHV